MPVKSAVNSETFKCTAPTDTTIVLTRLFDAPRHLVFAAMTKPEHVKRWWGNIGDGYSMPVCEADVRVGGRWRYVNRMPSGQTVAFTGVYREIKPPERLVFTEVMEPHPEPGSVVTTVFTVERGKTRMTLSAQYPTKDVRDMVLGSGMAAGAGISYDRLDDLVVTLQRS